MEVAGYIRVSSTRGRSGESFISPVEQRIAIERLAASKGLEVTSWLEELDESGGNADRPKWLVVRDLIRQGKVKGVVVLNFSRWSRDTQHALASISEIRDAGGDIWSCQEDFDTRSPTGWMMLTQFFAVAQLYREQAREGFKVARRNAVERGVPTSRAPFGYIKDKDKRLIPDPETKDLVVELFTRKADGEPLSSLVKMLEAKGYSMSYSGVSDLLQSKTYLGRVAWGDVYNDEAHEPLISMELFARAQEARGVKPPLLDVPSSARAMLKSLVRCAGCGSTMLVFGASKKSPANYYCPGRTKGGCAERGRARIDELDAFVDDLITSTLQDRDTLAESIESTKEAQRLSDELALAERTLKDLLTNTTLAQTLGADEYALMISANKTEVERLRRELGRLSSRTEMMNISMRMIWPTLGVDEKRHVLHDWLKEIRVSKGRATLAERVTVIDLDGRILYEPKLHAVRPSAVVQPS